jgi:hypothetical protein
MLVNLQFFRTTSSDGGEEQQRSPRAPTHALNVEQEIRNRKGKAESTARRARPVLDCVRRSGPCAGKIGVDREKKLNAIFVLRAPSRPAERDQRARLHTSHPDSE